LAIEQQTPEIPRTQQIELDAPTEVELCSRGAVKLTHMDLADLKVSYRALVAEIQTERNRNDGLTARANTAETELRVLRATVNSTGRREIIVRLIELVIIALVSYAIEAAKSAAWTNFAVFCATSLVLVSVIVLIQWWPHKPERA